MPCLRLRIPVARLRDSASAMVKWPTATRWELVLRTYAYANVRHARRPSIRTNHGFVICLRCVRGSLTALECYAAVYSHPKARQFHNYCKYHFLIKLGPMGGKDFKYRCCACCDAHLPAQTKGSMVGVQDTDTALIACHVRSRVLWQSHLM